MPTLEDRKDYDNKQDNLAKYLWGLWLICMGVPLVSGAVLWVFYYIGLAVPETLKDWGVVGDFIGGMSNPLISGLTFLALIMTILQNQKVLRLTEEELAETRKEIELTREANEKQAEEHANQNELARQEYRLSHIQNALLQLSEAQNTWWVMEFQDGSSYTTVERFLNNSSSWVADHMARIEGNTSSRAAEIRKIYEASRQYIQMAESYLKLLIDLYEHDENMPMLKAMVAIQHNRLAILLKRGHLDNSFTTDQLDAIHIVMHRG